MTKKLLVKRNKPNIYRIARHTFYPGITEFSDPDVIKELESYESFHTLLKNKVHEIVESPSEDKPDTSTSDISQMSAKNAFEVIENTYAIPILEDMHQSESDNKSRKSILNAILDKIEDMKKVPKEKKKKDEE